MGLREDLSYEKRETEVPYIFTDASNIDDALEVARYAIADAKSFRKYAKETGIDAVKDEGVSEVKKTISLGMATGCFACGVAVCLLYLWCLGVI